MTTKKDTFIYFKNKFISLKPVLSNRFLQHIFFWLIFYILFFFIFKEVEPLKISFMAAGIQFPSLIIFTYLQLYFLIPHFLLKKKFLLYIFLSALFIKIYINVAITTLSFFVIPLRTGHNPNMYWQSLWTITSFQIYPLFGILTASGFAASIKIFKNWYLENERNKKIELEKTMLELEMLKAKVHPDFLFNTLNNLYLLTSIKSDKASVVVTHLSDLLRYMLYECNEKEVPLDKEIAMLKKYVELEKIRYGNRIDISFSFTGNTNELMIAPLLLLPFIENSFQHAVNELSDQCWINIHLHTENNDLNFNISNSFSKENTGNINYGMGLQTIKKRLQVIYAEKNELTIYEEEDLYAAKLKVYLNSFNTKVFLMGPNFIKPKQANIS